MVHSKATILLVARVLWKIMTTTFIFIVTFVTIPSVDANKISFSIRVLGVPMLQLHGLSPRSCGRKCECQEGCVYVNYNKRTLTCELMQAQNKSVNRSSDLVSRGVPALTDLQTTANREGCSRDNTSFCPDVTKDENTIVLGNMKLAGSKRAVQCTGVYELEGTRATTCTDKGVWSGFGKCIKLSTMRRLCEADSDCVDDGSECRNGTCGCMLGLSHNPATNSCVPFCPGEKYGDTFQILDGYAIMNRNKYVIRGHGMEVCMQLCLDYTTESYVCKHIEYDLLTWNRNPRCTFSDIQANEIPDIVQFDGCWFLQCDCAI